MLVDMINFKQNKDISKKKMKNEIILYDLFNITLYQVWLQITILKWTYQIPWMYKENSLSTNLYGLII